MNTLAQELFSLELKKTTIQMFLLTPSLKRVYDDEVKTISKVNLEERVIENLFETIIDHAKLIKEKTVVDFYDIDKQDDDYLISLNLGDVTELEKNLKVIEEEKYSRVHAHDLGPFLRKLRYFVISATQDNTTFYFIKKQSMSSLVLPKKDFYMFKDDVLTSLKDETIFTLPNTFDAVVVNGLVYINNESSFTSTFKYYEKQKTVAKEVLDEIRKLNIFSDFDKLEENILGSIAKFKRVSKVDPKSVNNISFEKIKELQDAKEVDLVVDPIERKVSFTTKEQLDDALDVILENFVQSRVSPSTFYALNKIRAKKK